MGCSPASGPAPERGLCGVIGVVEIAEALSPASPSGDRLADQFDRAVAGSGSRTVGISAAHSSTGVCGGHMQGMRCARA